MSISYFYRVRRGTGALPASYPVIGVEEHFTGGKAAGACDWPLTSI